MHYAEIYKRLKNIFPTSSDLGQDADLGISIKRYSFESEKAADYLSGSEHLYCGTHQKHFENDCLNEINTAGEISVPDYAIDCNKSFSYYIVKSLSVEKAEGLIFFFHGLNEKHWDKYLPWAYAMAKESKKAVVLFPIAFHMDRAPEEWSNKHLMMAIAKERAQQFPENNSSSSFLNAAISSRLEHFPQRLFWSGFQTYADVVQLIESINKGQIDEIKPNGTIDLFGYSIGSFFASILKMANAKNYFTDAKLFCFCGGMTIDRMFPISKYIMDASAAIKMQKTYAELLSANFSTDERLGHFQDWENHPEESWFKTMLRYNYFLKEREGLLRKISSQVKVMVLKQDEVAPPIEALNTMQGGYRDIPIQVIVDDFDYPYSHVNPFSLTHKYQEEVDIAFDRFANAVNHFYNQ